MASTIAALDQQQPPELGRGQRAQLARLAPREIDAGHPQRDEAAEREPGEPRQRVPQRRVGDQRRPARRTTAPSPAGAPSRPARPATAGRPCASGRSASTSARGRPRTPRAPTRLTRRPRPTSQVKTSVSTIRASSASPKSVESENRSSDGLNASSRPPPVVYGPCRSSNATEPSISAPTLDRQELPPARAHRGPARSSSTHAPPTASAKPGERQPAGDPVDRLDDPARRARRAGGHERRRLADRERERAGDRVRVRRRDPPGDHVGAVLQPGRELQHRGRAVAAEVGGLRRVDRAAGRVEQAHRVRAEVDRLAPADRHLAPAAWPRPSDRRA